MFCKEKVLTVLNNELIMELKLFYVTAALRSRQDNKAKWDNVKNGQKYQ